MCYASPFYSNRQNGTFSEFPLNSVAPCCTWLHARPPIRYYTCSSSFTSALLTNNGVSGRDLQCIFRRQGGGGGSIPCSSEPAARESSKCSTVCCRNFTVKANTICRGNFRLPDTLTQWDKVRGHPAFFEKVTKTVFPSNAAKRLLRKLSISNLFYSGTLCSPRLSYRRLRSDTENIDKIPH
jgi:hypothetical protein